MTPTPETPKDKPKAGFMNLIHKLKSAVSNAVPNNLSINDLKNLSNDIQKNVSENIKKVDLTKITDNINKIKDSVKSATHQNDNKPDSDKNKDKK